jgi:hypothetical protein
LPNQSPRAGIGIEKSQVVNIDPVENIQKIYAQHHNVMVTSLKYVHTRDEFIRRTRGGVFSLLQGADQYDMNESCERLCARTQQICGDMVLWGSTQLKDVSIVRKDTNFYMLIAVPLDEHSQT